MTDMQLKYMKVAAEVPKLQAESEQAQQYLKEAWRTDLDAQKIRNNIRRLDNLAEQVQSVYYKERWEGKELSDFFNWMYNPKMNTTGVLRGMVQNVMGASKGAKGLASVFAKMK